MVYVMGICLCQWDSMGIYDLDWPILLFIGFLEIVWSCWMTEYPKLHIWELWGSTCQVYFCCRFYHRSPWTKKGTIPPMAVDLLRCGETVEPEKNRAGGNSKPSGGDIFPEFEALRELFLVSFPVWGWLQLLIIRNIEFNTINVYVIQYLMVIKQRVGAVGFQHKAVHITVDLHLHRAIRISIPPAGYWTVHLLGSTDSQLFSLVLLYHLVMTNIANWKIHYKWRFYNGKIIRKWAICHSYVK